MTSIGVFGDLFSYYSFNSYTAVRGIAGIQNYGPRISHQLDLETHTSSSLQCRIYGRFREASLKSDLFVATQKTKREIVLVFGAEMCTGHNSTLYLAPPTNRKHI